MRVRSKVRAGCDCSDDCAGCDTWPQVLRCASQCGFWAPPEIEWEALRQTQIVTATVSGR